MNESTKMLINLFHTDHKMHAIISAALLGAWLPVWAVVTVLNRQARQKLELQAERIKWAQK